MDKILLVKYNLVFIESSILINGNDFVNLLNKYATAMRCFANFVL